MYIKQNITNTHTLRALAICQNWQAASVCQQMEYIS